MTKKEIAEFVRDFNEEALLADGLEDAFIGVAERCGQPALAVYDQDKCIRALMKNDGMSEEDAVDCFSFNTLGAWAGEHTPPFVRMYVPDKIANRRGKR